MRPSSTDHQTQLPDENAPGEEIRNTTNLQTALADIAASTDEHASRDPMSVEGPEVPTDNERSDGVEHDVDAVVGVRRAPGGHLEYEVRWVEGGDTTWEPECNIPDAAERLEHQVDFVGGVRHDIDGGTEYLVYWTGWADPTWEPLQHLEHAKEKVNDFCSRRRG